MIMLNRDMPERNRLGKGPKFRPGQLVRHKRYGYRGVVVAFDLECEAEEGWYQSNQTQPGRDQPWYHVLVHGSDQTTYPAQENLEEDRGRQPVSHPLLSYFFTEFVDGRYIRNSRPWPK